MAKPKKGYSTNPLVHGVQKFYSEHRRAKEDDTRRGCARLSNVEEADNNILSIADIPKRYTVYGVLLLLGPTFTTHTTAWHNFYSSLSSADQASLFEYVIKCFNSAGNSISHVAMNAPIVPTTSLSTNPSNYNTSNDGTNARQTEENILRSPINLVALYGDFGPTILLGSGALRPGQADFDHAFWITTAQHPTIYQTWAPRWTMFSRGNIREKGRILGVGESPFPGLSEDELCQPLAEIDVVDFYIGIGYFAFSYLVKGVRRVWGWELNGWSVEGVRRGCERNGWTCVVVRIEERDDIQKVCDEVVGELHDAATGGREVKCMIFQGDNRYAAEVMGRMDGILQGTKDELNVRHCNLGLLPTSEGAYEGATKVLRRDKNGWLHVHENAEIVSVEQTKDKVIRSLEKLVDMQGDDKTWTVDCEHTEMVKTFAPGVGHYVFDIKISPASARYSDSIHEPALLLL